MRQFVNTSLVKRNDFFGRGLIIFGLVLVIGSFFYSFENQDAILELGVVVVAGFIFSQVGLRVFAKWGDKPRNFEVLGAELRGFSDHHLLIHYALSAEHAFVCTGGVFPLIPIRNEGEVSAEDGILRISTPARNFFQRGRNLSLKRLQSKAAREAARVSSKLSTLLSIEGQLMVEPIFVFLHDNVRLAENIDDPVAVHVKQLKGLLKRLCKSDRILTLEQIDQIIETIT